MSPLQTPSEQSPGTQEPAGSAPDSSSSQPAFAATDPQPGASSRGSSRLRGSRPYDALDHHELIYLLDEIDDERSRARFREAVYISIIFWLLFSLVIVYGPRYLWHTPVLITAVPDRHRNTMTYLDTPPNIQRNRRRTTPAPHISERSTEAQSPKPSTRAPEPRAGSRVPSSPRPQPALPQAPTPQQAAPQPAAPAPEQQARNTPPTRTPPRPTTPLVDAPAPAPQRRPTFNNDASAGEAIQQAARNARSTGGGEAGDYGSTGRGSSGGTKVGTEILSDTQGVDFAKYLARLLADVKRNWLPLIPEECRPPLNKQGITGVRFTIQPDGRISAMNLDYSTHDVAIDRAAWGSIRALGQAQPLPSAFHGPNLELRIEFRVNKDMQ